MPTLRKPAPMLNKSNTNASPLMVAAPALPEKPAIMSTLKTAQYAPAAAVPTDKYAMLRAVMEKKFETNVTLYAEYISYQQELNKQADAQLEARSAVMLAADMGLGKTLMAIKHVHDALNNGKRVLLVLSPGIAKLWQGELRKYYKGDFAKVSQLIQTISGNTTLSDIADKQLLFITPSQLTYLLGYQWTKKTAEEEHPLYKLFCGVEAANIAPFRWPLIVSDEVHQFRNCNKPFYAFRFVCSNSAKRVLLTATPFHNSPYSELSNYLELLKPNGTFPVNGKPFNFAALWNRNNFFELVDTTPTVDKTPAAEEEDEEEAPEDSAASAEEIDEDWFEEASNGKEQRALVKQYIASGLFPTLMDITKHSGLFVRMTKETVSAKYAAIAHKIYDRVGLEPSAHQLKAAALLSELPSKNQLAILTHTSSVNEDPALIGSVADSKTGKAWSVEARKKALALAQSGTIKERSPKASWIADNLESLLDLPATLAGRPANWSKLAIVTKRKTCMENLGNLVAERLLALSAKYPVLSQTGVFKISGDTDDIDKESQAFNETDAPCVIILMHDLGFGYNLQTANKMVLCSVWWNPGQDRQVHDRIHRISSPFEEVHIIQLYITGSLDEHVLKLMDAKTTVIKEDCGDDYVLMHVYPTQRQLLAELTKGVRAKASSAGTKKRKRVAEVEEEDSIEDRLISDSEVSSDEDEPSESASVDPDDVMGFLTSASKKSGKDLNKLAMKYIIRATNIEKAAIRKRNKEEGTCPLKKKSKLY